MQVNHDLRYNWIMKTGTIQLPTVSAANLFEHVVKGQLSDGTWENSRPLGHWKFWCELAVEYVKDVTPNVITTGAAKKNNYGLSSIIEYVLPEMLKISRLSIVAGRMLTNEEATVANYLPATLKEFVDMQSGKQKHPYTHVQDAIEKFPLDMATTFYTVIADMKQLRADLKLIKQAMQTVRVSRY